MSCFKSRILASSILAGIAVLQGSAACAQTAPASVDDPGEVVVTGYRESLQKSSAIKRNADSIVDVISAEDVGKFPDNNVAESLSHLPGLSVDRQFGEGERISILGTDPALNRVLINGETVASADWGGDPSDTSGRIFNYLLLSPEIIGVATVVKSTEARIEEGSIGGTVLIDTRRPLDLDANTLRGSAGYSYNDRSAIGNPRGSLLYSWKNPQNSFGLIAAFTYDREDLARAGIEIADNGYNSASSVGSKSSVVTGGNLATAVYPGTVGSSLFQQTREREGFEADAEYAPTDELLFNLTGILVEGVYTNLDTSEYALNTSGVTRPNLVSGTITNGVLNSANYFPSAKSQLAIEYRRSPIQTGSVNLNGEWDKGALTVKADVGYTRATGNKQPEYLATFNGIGPYSWNLAGQNSGVAYSYQANEANVFKATAGNPVGIGSYLTTDQEKYAKMDATYDIHLGPFSQILAGTKYSFHINNEDATTSSGQTPTLAAQSQLSFGTSDSSLFSGLTSNPGLTTFPVLSINALKNYVSSTDGPATEAYTNEYAVYEQTISGYLQANFKGEAYHGNIGVRLVHTTDESTYWAQPNNGVQVFEDVHTGYTKPLPAANIAYDVMSDLVVRGGVAEVIARPRYSNLANSYNLNTGNDIFTASGGNPNLKPYQSTNYDTATDWYFSKSGVLSTELFYRDISNYTVTKTVAQALYNPAINATNIYQVTEPFNAENAHVKGAEIDFHSDIAYGFGLEANYTYGIASTKDSLNLPYLSRSTVNVIPYYEDGPLQARLSYSYRTKYYTALGILNAAQITASYAQLDFSASYQINQYAEIKFNAQNLLDSTYFNYNGTPDQPLEYYKNGRVVSATLGFKL